MEELQDFSEEQNESNFDLKAELYKYLGYWKWILFGISMGLLIAFLFNRYTIPKYRSQSTMMIVDESENSAINAIPSGAGAILSVDEGIQNHIEKLKSKKLVESVVSELDLNTEYYTDGNVITVEAYKNSDLILKFLTPDSIADDSFIRLDINPISDTRFNLIINESDYSKEHNIGDIIKYENLQFTLIPRNNESSLNLKNSTIIHRLTKDVGNDYISRLQINS